MRVALYARVSTEEQSLHGLSIDAQLAALREWAKPYTVAGEYVDAGVSARIPIKKRPELQRLLRDVEAGKIDLVAFAKLDRWTRNIREYYKAQDVLDAHGVAWRAIHEDYETQTAAGRLKTNIMLAVAQDEADRTSERVKAVFEDKRRKGLVVNGKMPPGIVYSEGHIYPGQDADRVRAIFDRYIACRSVNQTARDAENILGAAYSVRGMRQMLTNEKYLVAGVIAMETWNAAQAILKERETRTVRTDRVYLFSGLLVCPVCGYKLTVRTCAPGGGKRYVYYRCDQSLRSGRCTWRGSVREDALEEYLQEHILDAVRDYNVRIARQQKKKPVDTAALQRKLDRLTDLYVDGKIDKETFDKKAAPITDALKNARSAPQVADTEKICSALGVYSALTKAARKALWSLLVRRITPREDGYSIDLILP